MSGTGQGDVRFVVYFPLFWLSSIGISVSFLASSRRQHFVCGPSPAGSSGQERAGLEKSCSFALGGTCKTTVHQDRDEITSQASQPGRRHPQPKPSLRLETKCELQTAASQRSAPGRREASCCWTSCHSPPSPAARHTQRPACPPCLAGMLGCIVRTWLKKEKKNKSKQQRRKFCRSQPPPVLLIRPEPSQEVRSAGG